jgi:hypothetical protein
MEVLSNIIRLQKVIRSRVFCPLLTVLSDIAIEFHSVRLLGQFHSPFTKLSHYRSIPELSSYFFSYGNTYLALIFSHAGCTGKDGSFIFDEFFNSTACNIRTYFSFGLIFSTEFEYSG